jgi:hypothetical protein
MSAIRQEFAEYLENNLVFVGSERPLNCYVEWVMALNTRRPQQSRLLVCTTLFLPETLTEGKERDGAIQYAKEYANSFLDRLHKCVQSALTPEEFTAVVHRLVAVIDEENVLIPTHIPFGYAVDNSETIMGWRLGETQPGIN